MRRAISAYLNAFNSRMPPEFDLQNGSIGNFILAGAYFSHGHNINTAISIFRDICEITGNVWPVSLANDAHLSARLSDGRQLNRQHHITSLGKIHPAATIEALKLENTAGESTSTPFNANKAAIDAIRSADLIVYGPGSLFTSILPHFLVNGIVDAIGENGRCTKDPDRKHH